MSRPRIPEAGFFVYIASWPWALTYHLFATRGSRGGLALLSFTALHVVTYLLAAAPLSIRWVPVSAKVSDDHQSSFGAPWTTGAEFEAITVHFQPPSEDDRFNVIRHERA